MKNFFDEVHHCFLLRLLYKKVKCSATLRLIRKWLRLPFNQEKSGIRRPVNFEMLGCKFVPTYEKGVKEKYQLVVAEKSWKTLNQKLKFITRKTTPSSLSERIQKLKEVQRGWINYFRTYCVV